ncbi:FkbM family methyltransferase [Maritimibacter sp. DP1N21-5]|uniref:FkbM family methyltransferase n=1 Tax=Maritimibacter sp. DP1N21-5 TaxID=2836867 RepID=UPI001C481BF5|nr:FkbM family methyltransferase [Maritimibacter sp. DP1N21-5]MBV7408659.1 FkbM family methyltransferase [Maritimibacter sp. DP1N21-5]
MAQFKIDDIALRVPNHALTAKLREALNSGRYEVNESRAIRRHLQPGDRVLDIGAGAGFVSIHAGRIVGGENVISVEGNPTMMAALRENLDRNGMTETTVLHAAVVADGHEGDTVRFETRQAFWASGVAKDTTPDDKTVEVPAVKLSELLAEFKPTVVSMDVEGAELHLCQQPWPDCVRLLVMEIHTGQYPPSAVKAMFDGMSKNNMTYMPWGTIGEVVVLQRCEK